MKVIQDQLGQPGRTLKWMQTTTRMASVVSSTPPARRHLIQSVDIAATTQAQKPPTKKPDMPDVPTTPTFTEVPREQWRIQLQAEIAANETRFRRSKNRWNCWYYGFLAGGVGLPALSAFFLKLETITDVPLKNDVAAALAVLGAVATSLMVAFNFRKRWVVSRTTRTELQQLKVDLMTPDTDMAVIAQRLKASLVSYNEGVVEE